MLDERSRRNRVACLKANRVSACRLCLSVFLARVAGPCAQGSDCRRGQAMRMRIVCAVCSAALLNAAAVPQKNQNRVSRTGQLVTSIADAATVRVVRAGRPTGRKGGRNPQTQKMCGYSSVTRGEKQNAINGSRRHGHATRPKHSL